MKCELESLTTIRQKKTVYNLCLLVWCDRVRRLTTDLVAMRSSPAAGHIRCALLANPHKKVESTFIVVLAYLSKK